jgi:hypothetical protein
MLFLNSSLISFQLLIFSSSLLFNIVQTFFPLLFSFPLTTNFTTSRIDYNKLQPRFIFPRHLHSCYVSCLSFFLRFHYYTTCFHCSYLDNDYNNNKFFQSSFQWQPRRCISKNLQILIGYLGSWDFKSMIL